jgi:predicted permease
VQEELQFHFESIVREYQQSGLSEEAARLAARRRFGSVLRIKERGHDVRGAGRLEEIGREIRHAARRLRRSPTFTVASVVTLALAIGANVSIFAVVHRVVLNPLPYPDSDRLIQLDHGMPRINMRSGIGMTVGLYHQYQDRAGTLDEVAIYRPEELTLTGNGEPERIRVTRTTATLAPVLRVQPALGRWFTQEERAPGAPQVALLSQGLWMRRYGGDPGILGRPVTLNGVATEVVGVMPASFAFPDPRVDAWIADHVSRATGFGLPFSRIGVARLRAGATVAGARTELDALIADLPQAYPGDPGVLGNVGDGGLKSAAITLKEATVGQVARALWILFASVGLVLLVACANVANLFLVRSEARQREVAVRRALGSGTPGIVRYFLAESVLLSLAGGISGLALAWGAVRLLVRFGPATLPRLEEVRVDGVAVAFTCVLTALAAVAFGAIPLLRGVPVSALYESGRSNTASRGRQRVRQLLMGGQVGLALVLLAASGLMVRSFQNLRGMDIGFDARSALTFRIGLPEREYPTRRAAAVTHQAILDQLTALPGVSAVSAASGLPLADTCMGNTVLVRGVARSSDPTERPLARWCAVAGDVLPARGIRLLRGRGIDRGDVERSEPIVVVNQAFANVLFPNQNPIGEHLRSNAPPKSTPRPDGFGGWTWDGAPPWLEIVGVVSNTPTRALTEANPVPTIYMPMSIAGGPDIPAIEMLGPNIASMSYVVRSATPPLGLLPSVRRAVEAVDPNLALAQVRTLQDIVDSASAQMAFTMVLLAIASGVALMLGIVGIYGVVSYIVSQRTGEIGVRLALGAEPGAIVRMIVRQSGLVALAGITVGLAAALAGSRLIEALLYDVSPRDPGVFTAVTLALLGVAVVACWLPAWRASRIDPAVVLRSE